MGRDAFFTREQAFKAADEVAAEGQEVTTRNLRAYLGGGSFGTISKYVREWEDLRKKPTAPIVEMPTAVLSAFESTWKVAMSHATKELNAEKEKAAEEVRAIDLKLMEAIGAIEDADNEKNDLLDKLGETKKALEASESKNSLLIVDKATLTAVNGELKKKVEILEASVLKGQMNYEQLERKHAEDLNQLRGAQAEEVSALKVEAARMEAARDAASEEAKKYLQRLAEESKESKAVVAKLEQKLESLTKEKDEVVKKASGLAGQLEAVEKHNGELLATIKSGQARK